MSFIGCFLIAVVATPIIRTVALSSGLTDEAGGDPLKIHEKPVALLGGAGVFMAVLFGMLAARYSIPDTQYPMLWSVVTGGSMVFGVGLWDDVRAVNPRVRIALHLSAGIIVLLAGIRVDFVPVVLIAVPVTLFYIAGAINAFNVTDGMDGLCAGISLMACAGFFFTGLQQENMFLVGLSAIVFMSLLGFLPYNFYPARIFLGDAGSGFVGFMLGVMAVMATAQPHSIARFIAPILMLGLPVCDMACAIVRRLACGRHPFSGDREHLYDLLLEKGWSQRMVWVVMVGAQAVLVGIALLAYS